MKKLLNIRLRYLLAAVLLLFISINVTAQIQPYQVNSTAGYIDTAKYDSVNVPYVKGTKVTGVITNEDETNSLIVYFAKTDSVSRDINSYVLIGPGKRLKFSFQGRKIYRYASADSVFSQVIFGEGVDLGSGGRNASGANMNLYGYLHKDSLSGDYSFTGSLDLTDAEVTPNNNLYGYAHKDSANAYSMVQSMDSVIVTRDAILDTVRVGSNIHLSDGASYRIFWGTTSSIYGSSGDLWLNANHRFNAAGYLVGDGVLGQPYLTKSGSLSGVHYGFYNDVNSGLLWNSADNISLVTGGTARVTYSNTEVGFNVPAKLKSYTTSERDALTPQAGWLILNTTAGKVQAYVGGSWVDLH